MVTYGSEFSVAVRHLGRDVGHDVALLGNLAVVDPEEIEERRGLTPNVPSDAANTKLPSATVRICS